MTSSVYLGNLEKGNLSDFDWKALNKAKDELGESNLAIVDKGTQTINDIRAHARTLQQNGGLRAIVIHTFCGLEWCHGSAPSSQSQWP